MNKPGARPDRVAARERPEKWQRPPLRIESNECISCDACIAACPPSLGAVFRRDGGLVIVPELCSGCGLCVAPVCPVDCISENQDWTPTSEELWPLALGPDDPYTDPENRLTLDRVRRW
ncbi:4Fe-4S dicluster-binding protein [Streptomyces sp. NPDC001073]